MSAEWPGTLEQQQTVRDALALEFGSDQWKLTKRLDQAVNADGRHYLSISFPPDDMWPPGYLAIAGATGISMRAGLALSAIPNIVLHESGHCVDQLLLTQEDRTWFMHQISGPDLGQNNWTNYSETFADAVRDWWLGISWPSLTPILVPA